MPFDAPTPMTRSDVQVVLELARHRLRSHRLWCRYNLSRGSRVCMIGAVDKVVRQAMKDADAAGAARKAANRALREALPEGWDGAQVNHFNDDPSTRHKDVLAVFDRAIAKVEEKDLCRLIAHLR